RPATDAVYQKIAEQPRLRQSARHRADVARPIRLGVPRIRLRGVSYHDPSGRIRPAARVDDAGAAVSPHDQPPGRPLRHYERDGRRFCPPLAAPAVRALSSGNYNPCALCAAFWTGRSTGPTPSPDRAFSLATPMRRRADARGWTAWRRRTES